MSAFDFLRPRERAITGSIYVALVTLVITFHIAPWAAPPAYKPRFPSVLLGSAAATFNKNGRTVSPAMMGDVLQAAQNDLLDPSPFYFSALTLNEAKNSDRVLALLDEAIKRNPRHYFARRWRARLYQRSDAPKAVLEISRLFSLDPAHGEVYVDALVDLAQSQQGQETLLRLLSERQPWSDAFIRRSNQVLTDGAFLTALASNLRSANNEYVRSLANQGDIERAFLVWQTAMSKKELLRFSWPADPTFRAEAATGAIGWRTNPEIATRETDGLYVYFDGKGERIAAEQTMLLGAGYRYTLTATMSGSIQPQSGAFQWRLTCKQTETVVGELTVSSVSQEPRRYSTAFFIPFEGCAVQTLTLRVSSGQYMHPAHLKVADVKITEAQNSDALAPASPVARGTQQ